MKKPDDAFSLRIIGGKLKGRSLQLTTQKGVRPTKAIIRESLFNRLGAEVAGVTFVELFAGSGSVGIEAFSRGAKKVYLIEQDSMALSLLKHNHERLDLGNAVEILRGDVFELLPSVLHGQASVILYCDPPFPIRQNMQDMYERCLKLLESVLNQEVLLLVFEMMSGVEMPSCVGGLGLECSRKFGKTTLHYYTPQACQES